MKKTTEQCAQELCKFIMECDGDTLAAVYEQTFTGTKNVCFVEEENENYLEFDTDEFYNEEFYNEDDFK